MNNRVETIECQIKLMRDQLNALNGITVLAPAEPQRQHPQEVIEVEPVLVQQGTDFQQNLPLHSTIFTMRKKSVEIIFSSNSAGANTTTSSC